MGYRVYTALARGHARTQLLYRFVDRTATAQALDDVVRVVLGEAADLMHAERSYLLEVDDAEGPGATPRDVRSACAATPWDPGPRCSPRR